MKKVAILLLFVFVILAVVVSAYFFINRRHTISTPKQKITVAWTNQPYLVLMYVAAQKGYFADEGLDVTYKNFPSGRDALDDVVAGNADVATVGEAPVVRKIYEGYDVDVLSILYSSTKNTALVARRDRGIAKIEDIKGKKIAVFKNSTSEFFLFSYLASQGIQLSQVTIVDALEKDMPSMLETGKVDAVALINPYLFQIKKDFKPDAISVFESDIYTNTSVLAGMSQKVVQNKETFVKLLRALKRAQSLYETDREESIKQVLLALPENSEETVLGSFKDFTPGLGLNNVLLTVLTREAAWFYKNGVYTSTAPDFRGHLFSSYLKEVDPGTVTLF
ncbi:ABC transporter substrate-binding protein [Candidatus Curtissbacteria bacterium]|nr:ABC transporter substrate-binding protein [Candidatus Curtissbacteria bacterium]